MLIFPINCVLVPPTVNPDLDPETLCLDGRFNHFNQLQSRLDFVRSVNTHVPIAAAIHS